MNKAQRLSILIAYGLLQACVTTTDSLPPRSDEEAAQANLNLGTAYLQQGRPQLALERLERALSQNPQLVDVHTTIALVYDQLGQREEAERHYERAVRLESSNSVALNSYAVFLCRDDRWRDAERHFRRAADNPRYATPEVALANAGVCARGVPDLEKAEDYFRAALAANPLFSDALYHMTDLAYRRESYPEAHAFMQRYFNAAPANPTILRLCFRIERQMNNLDAAQSCATQLKERFPESREASELLEL